MENREIEAMVREVIEKLAQGQEQERAVGQAMPFPGWPASSAGADAFSKASDNAPENHVFPRPIASAMSSASREAGMSRPENLVSTGSAQTPVTMPLALAVELIEKVEAKAAQWDMRVVTAISDASARPVAIHCMDGAYIGSFDIALNKTYTSIAFQMSTAKLGTLCGPGESLYGIQFTNQGRIVIFGGGEVLKRNGRIVGALGVSGGSAKQDTALAAYGKKVFEEVANCL